jgi:uncharacterized protein (DUF2141 family)
MRLPHTATALLLGAATACSPAWAGDVQVRVMNVGSAAGTVRAEICRADEWLKDGCVHKAVTPAIPGVTTITLKNVEPGTWAVVVFHDRNNDGEVDMNLLGIPTEGIGFSRDPSLGLKGPSFNSAALMIGEQGAVMEIHLKFE